MEKVDQYIERNKKWKEEIILLRKICLQCGLDEDFKWMHPCYTFRSKNIVVIQDFKNYCALMFFKGALLKDTDEILVPMTKNVQAARQIRFTTKKEIMDLNSTIKTYIFEAVEVEKAGLEVKMKKTSEYDIPEELEEAFKNSTEFKTAFYELTPGRQRGYLLYFAQAKQSKTREARIEKLMPQIFAGKGYNER